MFSLKRGGRHVSDTNIIVIACKTSSISTIAQSLRATTIRTYRAYSEEFSTCNSAASFPKGINWRELETRAYTHTDNKADQ